MLNVTNASYSAQVKAFVKAYPPVPKLKQPTTPEQLEQALQTACYPKSYQIQPQQRFVSAFINPNQPFKRLLAYHEIGSGKTCAAIRIAEQFNTTKPAIVVLPANLIENFKSELRSECTDNRYVTPKQRQLLKQFNRQSTAYQSLIDAIDAKINKHYTIYSYQKFITAVQQADISINNSLLIIDEVHNLISSNGYFYSSLISILDTSRNYRLVILTATPIFDKPNEIALTMNLLLDQNKRMPIDKAFDQTYISTTRNKNGTVTPHLINAAQFQQSVYGYISYYPGAPAYTYPKTIIKITKSVMSPKQLKEYLKYDASKANTPKPTSTSQENEFLINTRLVSNIYIPKAGLTTQVLKHMQDYSTKFTEILNNINKTKGTLFIYSNFVQDTLLPFAKFLFYHGFNDFDKTNKPGKNTYALWVGKMNINRKGIIKDLFNHPSNDTGNNIKIILASPTAREGVSFLRVNTVHLFEPYWNWSRMDQIIGRAVRYCSHKDVRPRKRKVTVHIHIAWHPKIKESADQHILATANDKRALVLDFVDLIKDSAVDCPVFGKDKSKCFL